MKYTIFSLANIQATLEDENGNLITIDRFFLRSENGQNFATTVKRGDCFISDGDFFKQIPTSPKQHTIEKLY